MCFDIKHISNILNQASDSILMCCWLDLTVKRSLQSAQKYKKNDIKNATQCTNPTLKKLTDKET